MSKFRAQAKTIKALRPFLFYRDFGNAPGELGRTGQVLFFDSYHGQLRLFRLKPDGVGVFDIPVAWLEDPTVFEEVKS